MSYCCLIQAKIVCDAPDSFAGEQPPFDYSDQFVGEFRRAALLSVCDDGQDRWLAPTEEYQSAIDTVLNRCLDKGHYMGDEDSEDREDRKAAYDDLCSECPAMYSNIGSGSYNAKKSELLDLLAETLDEDTVSEVADQLHIEIEESV